MEETKQCPYCGGIVLDIAKKCKYCGRWIENIETILCPICKEEIPKDLNTYPFCKENIENYRDTSKYLTKVCPICCEEIPDNVSICPYCHEYIISMENKNYSDIDKVNHSAEDDKHTSKNESIESNDLSIFMIICLLILIIIGLILFLRIE